MTSRSLDEHRQAAIALAPPMMALDLRLADAIGCALAADLVAPADVPALPVAAWDGFAVRSGDTEGAGRSSVATLEVTHDVAPGDGPSRLAPGMAARVASGAALPHGADAVIRMAADARRELELPARVAPGYGVVAVGSQVRAGEVLLDSGARLGPGQVAALAACGVSVAHVTPAPRVVVIVVGSEVRGHAATRHASTAPVEATEDATGPLVAALLASAGARVVRTVVVPDDANELATHLADASVEADLVVTTGGLSDDWRDVLMPLARRRYEAQVWDVRVEPARAHGLGIARPDSGREVPLLMLPGGPVNAAVAMAAYGAQVVWALRGGDMPRSQAAIDAGWESPYGFSQAVLVRRTDGGMTPVGTPDAPRTGDLARADGVAIVPEDTVTVTRGDALDVVWWRR